MYKVFCLVCISFILLGCNEPISRQVQYKAWPKDLDDCKVYEAGSDFRVLTIVRCPNSSVSTSYKAGKVDVKVITVDGIKYQEVKE